MARSSLPLFLTALLLGSLSCQSLPTPEPPAATEAPGARVAAPLQTLSYIATNVQIRRTHYGVPHILANDLAAGGYGLAWVMMEDYREEVVRAILRSNGRWGLAMGRDSIGGDFAGRMAHEYAAWTYHRLPWDVREIYSGFAQGMNDFIMVYKDELPDWVTGDFNAHDIAARDISVWDEGAVRSFARARVAGTSTEPTSQEEGGALPASDLLSTWMAWAQRDGEEDPEVGSNAWAFGPERSESGNALLLRNPHLSWTAGYYEAHLKVIGSLDFYGDFRLGGPFTTIGGFNRRLGWATTNNYPDLEQLYALLRDPEDPGAYLFDGGSVPLEVRSVTVDFKEGEGLGSETRDFKFSALGPVIHETPDTLYVVKAHQLSQFRVGEQWLRMMQAQTLEDWKAAMAIRAKVSSNLTYADADGNIFIIWNAAIPFLPHRYTPGEPVLATSSNQTSTMLFPFEALPQLLNPRGGYIQNANDPPYYYNLFEPLSPISYPENFPEPRLRFRSQNSLELVHSGQILSLEDMVELKHSMKMTLADRVKEDLVEAVRESGATGEVAEAIALVESWDNTVGRETRGSTLFEIWAQRYFSITAGEDQYRTPWSPQNPVGTPNGLGNRKGAAEAFTWAMAEMTDRFGSWDVKWGEVHRLRAGDKDLPVGGCASALGCFRVLGYVEDEDGKFKVHRGDGWVLAVEFSDPPRAYSVLAYGNSNRPDSPYFYDQAELFADNRMKPVAFTEEDIQRDLVRQYQPTARRNR